MRQDSVLHREPPGVLEVLRRVGRVRLHQDRVGRARRSRRRTRNARPHREDRSIVVDAFALVKISRWTSPA
jgi:hypothetical protein